MRRLDGRQRGRWKEKDSLIYKEEITQLGLEKTRKIDRILYYKFMLIFFRMILSIN